MKKLLLAIAVLGSISLYSCKKDSVSNPSNNAQMTVNLTDAPGDYDAVNIDVQGIEVNHETKGWISLTPKRTGTYNLLELRNGTDVLLCQGDIPAGRLSQIRLILGTNNTVTVKGTTYPLDAPSAEQSGLKLNLDAVLNAGTAYSFWLDFDAGRSIVETGSGKYMLKPVVRSYTQLTNGRIKGSIALLYPGTIVYAINGADTFSTYPNADGSFMFCGLPEANYTLNIQTSSSVSLNITGIKVSFGTVTDLGVLTLTP